MWESFESLIRNALAEDHAADDVTTRLLPPTAARAIIRCRQKGVFCGEKIVAAFGQVVTDVTFESLKKDGARTEIDEPVVQLAGPATQLLSVERTLLNALSHVSGIATRTRSFVDECHPHPTRILATRKTLPGLRALQLYGVTAGGGFIHRRSLSDGILIKENHQVFAGSESLLAKARAIRSPLHRVEVEVQSFSELETALNSEADVIMLDNFGMEELQKAIRRIGDKAQIEVSGGITLERVRKIAELGVHYISVGSLTHSVPALDFSLDITPNNI